MLRDKTSKPSNHKVVKPTSHPQSNDLLVFPSTNMNSLVLVCLEHWHKLEDEMDKMVPELQCWKFQPFEASRWVSIHSCLSWRTQTPLWAWRPETSCHQECLWLLCRLTEIRRNLPPHINLKETRKVCCEKEGRAFFSKLTVIISSEPGSGLWQGWLRYFTSLSLHTYRYLLYLVPSFHTSSWIFLSFLHYPPSSSQSRTV